MLEQKQSAFWWTRNLRYFSYFVRELSGVAIAFYVMYFLSSIYFNAGQGLFGIRLHRIFTWIAFGAAIIHALTWFWVMAKLAPIKPSRAGQMLLFFAIIGGVAAASYFQFIFFYK